MNPTISFRKLFEYVKEYEGAYHEAIVVFYNIPIAYNTREIGGGVVEIKAAQWRRSVCVDLYFMKIEIDWKTKAPNMDYALPKDMERFVFGSSLNYSGTGDGVALYSEAHKKPSIVSKWFWIGLYKSILGFGFSRNALEGVDSADFGSKIK